METEISGPTCPKLAGTEMWYEAAYEWSIVAMAQVSRSQLSAEHHKCPLFVIQAEDQFLSAVDAKDARLRLDDNALRQKIGIAVLSHPNMNETGRLPGFALLHIGMKVRLTQTSESGIAVTDATGVVVGMDFDDREPRSHGSASECPQSSVVVLQYMPRAVYVQLDAVDGVQSLDMDLIMSRPCLQHNVTGVDSECTDCISCKNVVAVTPFLNAVAWWLDVKLDRDHVVKVKVRRTHVPLTCSTASTLHVLQGCTCDPGLIFHWSFPKILAFDIVWLSVYVALSRVRKLSNLRSVGLTPKIKALIEGGPPDSMPEMFARYFSQKEMQTRKDAKTFMQELGWT